MSENNKNGTPKPGANIFQIVDAIVQNVDRTKKLVVIMLIAIVVSVPASFHITNVLVGPPYSFGFARIIVPFFVIIAFVIVGMRQWMVLSKWTKRYKEYKELQRRLDEKFDFEDASGQ